MKTVDVLCDHSFVNVVTATYSEFERMLDTLIGSEGEPRRSGHACGRFES